MWRYENGVFVRFVDMFFVQIFFNRIALAQLFGFQVGTINRLLRLLDAGALSLERTRYVVIDMEQTVYKSLSFPRLYTLTKYWSMFYPI